MANTYKPRIQDVDAGRYSFHIETKADGSVAFTVVHISPDAGVEAVAHGYGWAEPAHGGALFGVLDAYDATNAVRIIRGGGRPAATRPPALGRRRCDRCGVDLGPPVTPPRLDRCADCKAAAEEREC